MIKEFIISRGLNKFAESVEKNAKKFVESDLKLSEKWQPSVTFYSDIMAVITAMYKFVSAVMRAVGQNPEARKAYVAFLHETVLEFAKRIRAGASLISHLSKDRSVKRSLEFLENCIEDVKISGSTFHATSRIDDLLDKISSESGAMWEEIRAKAAELRALVVSEQDLEELEAYSLCTHALSSWTEYTGNYDAIKGTISAIDFSDKAFRVLETRKYADGSEYQIYSIEKYTRPPHRVELQNPPPVMS